MPGQAVVHESFQVVHEAVECLVLFLEGRGLLPKRVRKFPQGGVMAAEG